MHKLHKKLIIRVGIFLIHHRFRVITSCFQPTVFDIQDPHGMVWKNVLITLYELVRINGIVQCNIV